MQRMSQTAMGRVVAKLLRQNPDEDSGLTLLETLVAIIVIALTVSAITPAFVLALATRVRSQRIEQAMQLARNEVDNVRLAMELTAVDNPNTAGITETRVDLLPEDVGTGEPRDVPAPTSFIDLEDAKCTRATKPASGEACMVSIDRIDTTAPDKGADFAVQAYRVNSYTPTGSTDPVAFEIGVRVYAYEAIENAAAGNLTTVPTSAGLTSGTDGETSSYLSAPLAVIYTTIIRSEDREALCEYYQLPDVNPTGTDPISKGLKCN
ncbi:MAG: hypothetical protein AAFQ89_09365 [Cyanobacteria bacterium J06626_18]